MKNKIRLIISDLDFTLLDQNGELSMRTKKVLQQILDAGIIFVPASSRHYEVIPQWFKSEKRIPYIVSSNGAIIHDNIKNEKERSLTLPINRVKQILMQAERFGNTYWTCCINGNLFSNHRILLDSKLIGLEEHHLKSIIKDRIIVPNIDFLDTIGENIAVEKIHFLIKDKDISKKQNLIQQLNTSDIMISSSHINNIEISHVDATKGNALRWLMGKYGFSKQEVIACGDNMNDLSMLTLSENSIGVENAITEVKQIVRYHASSYDDDGIAKMLNKILFNKLE